MKKILITGCSREGAWHQNKIGERFELLEKVSEDVYIVDYDRDTPAISSKDCHVIQEAWAVMKEALETGRETQWWDTEDKEWSDNDPSGFYPGRIYRIKPLPPNPKEPPYRFFNIGDADILRGMWIRKKSDGSEYQITSIQQDCVWLGASIAVSYKKLFIDYVQSLSGEPCGVKIEP